MFNVCWESERMNAIICMYFVTRLDSDLRVQYSTHTEYSTVHIRLAVLFDLTDVRVECMTNELLKAPAAALWTQRQRAARYRIASHRTEPICFLMLCYVMFSVLCLCLRFEDSSRTQRPSVNTSAPSRPFDFICLPIGGPSRNTFEHASRVLSRIAIGKY